MNLDSKTWTIIDLIKIVVALFHLFLAIHSWATLGSYFELTNLETWTPFIIGIFAVFFIFTFTDKRWSYYLYIGFAFANLMIVLLGRTPEFITIQKAFFPFYLLFAGILIFDLKRVIYLAYHKRSASKEH
jgi:hypothetical protein